VPSFVFYSIFLFTKIDAPERFCDFPGNIDKVVLYLKPHIFDISQHHSPSGFGHVKMEPSV